jgi:hypothetical protein
MKSVVIPLAVFYAFVAVVLVRPPREPPDVTALVLFVAIPFAVAAAWTLREVFGFRATFDESGFRVSIPWSRVRSLRWQDLRSVEWRRTDKALSFYDGNQVVQVSVRLVGVEAFAEVCTARAPAEALSDREATAVLELMRMGRAF